MQHQEDKDYPNNDPHNVSVCSDQPKPTTGKLTYTEFGLVQYPDGTKAVMAWNKEEAKRLVYWHNAALAAQAYQHGLIHAETLKQLAAEREKLWHQIAEQLQVVLDCVDYLAGNCYVNEMIGATLDANVIRNARAALAKAQEGK